jgi:hypothetical protein
MDIKNFNFPELTALDMVFSTLKTDAELLAEARKRGFYNGYTKFNDLFSKLFFSGGKLNLKEDLDENFKMKAVPYLKAFMMSFEPKHEEKEAICAMLFSELIDIEDSKNKDDEK